MKKVNNPDKNIILVIGPAPIALRNWIIDRKAKGDDRRYFNLQSNAQKKEILDKCREVFDQVLQCKFSDPDSIRKVIKPFEKDLLAATSRSEAKMWYFANTIPHIPYLKTPTAQSLKWSVDKISMRKRFKTYDQSITPKFKVLKEYGRNTITEIEKNIGYPCVVKPSGLAASLLVTVCYHQEELEKSLGKVFKKVNILNRVYKEFQSKDTPTVLVEEYMEGDMYSIDGVVSARGKQYFYPPVFVKTGDKIGFDDFFGYLQMTPTKLKKNSVDDMEEVAGKAIKALGLRSTAFHAELLRTEEGWKMIEIGPRVGGFRSELYMQSFGLDAAANDIAIRIPEKPVISKKAKGYSAAMKIFAKKEGRIKSVKGVKKVQSLNSIVSMKQNRKKGDMAKFAKNGGKSAFNLILFNESRADLLADIRRIEKTLIIEV